VYSTKMKTNEIVSMRSIQRPKEQDSRIQFPKWYSSRKSAVEQSSSKDMFAYCSTTESIGPLLTVLQPGNLQPNNSC
jgi:hypothetical protein